MLNYIKNIQNVKLHLDGGVMILRKVMKEKRAVLILLEPLFKSLWLKIHQSLKYRINGGIMQERRLLADLRQMENLI